MTLTEAQKIEIRSLLQIRQSPNDLPGGKTLLTLLDETLNADQVNAVVTILGEYASVKYDTGTLQGEYNDDPAHRRMLLRKHLITVLNFDPADYQTNGHRGIERA